MIDNLKHKQDHTVWAAGFMSGTSLDGVDAAMVRTDGVHITEFGPAISVEFSSPQRRILEESVNAARDWNWQTPTSPPNADALDVLHAAHTAAYEKLRDAAGFKPDLLGVHGQTLLHRAPTKKGKGQTHQIFDAERFHKATDVPLVYNFRAADVARGGHGAPLAPAYHAALLASYADRQTSLAVLNLGGVANITWRGRDGTLVASDTGPANGPIDEWICAHNLGTYDKNGALAKLGRIDETNINKWLNHAWFDLPPPKSLDRYDFSASLAEDMDVADGAANLTAFSAASVARILPLLPSIPDALVVCGGGRHNPTLMAELTARLPCAVLSAEDMGWRGDSIEAEAFALLALRHVRGLPLSWPLTTGVPSPMCGGVMIGELR